MAVGQRRRELAKFADAHAVRSHDGGGTPWCQPAVATRLGANLDAERLGDAFRHSLDVEEVDRAASAAPVIAADVAGPGTRKGATLPVRPREPIAQLEEPHVAPLPAAVVRHRIDQTGKGRRP